MPVPALGIDFLAAVFMSLQILCILPSPVLFDLKKKKVGRSIPIHFS